MSIVLQLSLCVLSVIQLTSSQSIHDVTTQANDVSSCGSSELSEDVLRQLVTVNSQLAKLANAVCQLQRDVAEVKTDVGEVKTNMSQLQRDVGEIKTNMSQLQRDVGEVKTDVGEVQTSMSQLQRDVTEVKAVVSAKCAGVKSSCTCQEAGTNSPCVHKGGYDCTCDYTNNCSSSHVCGEASTCHPGYQGLLPPPICPENVALLKPALQSGQFEDAHATYAADGLLSSDVSCTAYDKYNDSWWAVDLGSPMDVASVCVTNDYNQRFAQRRLSYFVAGLTSNNPGVTAPVYKQYRYVQYDKTLPPGATASVSFAPTTDTFRYVIIQQYNTAGPGVTDAVCLSEVKVFKREITADPRACTPGTPGICHQHANCTQLTPYQCACSPESSYRCVCNPGYNGDGLTCSP